MNERSRTTKNVQRSLKQWRFVEWYFFIVVVAKLSSLISQFTHNESQTNRCTSWCTLTENNNNNQANKTIKQNNNSRLPTMNKNCCFVVRRRECTIDVRQRNVDIMQQIFVLHIEHWQQQMRKVLPKRRLEVGGDIDDMRHWTRLQRRFVCRTNHITNIHSSDCCRCWC